MDRKRQVLVDDPTLHLHLTSVDYALSELLVRAESPS